ncbi:hypothetical protein [Microvirga sp. VF16]|uniref:hypothetical protein n=1 Tax=Microvirga sp. VF16 TaxID=2807101 RepID=UPI00193D8EB0|nr:hypothetical protein [Microvirga sp. VF16]QRM32306.1 hypothetical protein JO965_29730 [Microvirga sp. VF16]
MTSQPDLTSAVFHDPGAMEEIRLLDHRIQFGPTRAGWVSFVAGQGQRPTIALACDRHTLLTQSQKLVEQRAIGRK